LGQEASATNTRVDGITALITASVAGHTAAVQMLLEVDAYPKAGDQDGLTQLMNAAKNYTVAILQLLTQAVDDIDHRAMYLNWHMNMPMRSSICQLRVPIRKLPQRRVAPSRCSQLHAPTKAVQQPPLGATFETRHGTSNHDVRFSLLTSMINTI
jgi:hypothetical protein